MVGQLPSSIELDGTIYDIRTDYRDILRIILAFGDPDLETEHQVVVCLKVLYKDFDSMPESRYEKAYEKAVQFIDCNRQSSSPKASPRTMDWEQDESLIFAAINRVAGMEVRDVPYMHWWTFMGFFAEIGECTFSQIQSLRYKKAKGKKLEKYEREYWNANKSACEIKPKLTEEEKKAKSALHALLS